MAKSSKNTGGRKKGPPSERLSSYINSIIFESLFKTAARKDVPVSKLVNDALHKQMHYYGDSDEHEYQSKLASKRNTEILDKIYKGEAYLVDNDIIMELMYRYLQRYHYIQILERSMYIADDFKIGAVKREDIKDFYKAERDYFENRGKEMIREIFGTPDDELDDSINLLIGKSALMTKGDFDGLLIQMYLIGRGPRFYEAVYVFFSHLLSFLNPRRRRQTYRDRLDAFVLRKHPKYRHMRTDDEPNDEDAGPLDF